MDLDTLKQQIAKKEEIARNLETTTLMRNDWMADVEAYTNNFIATMPGRRAYDDNYEPAFELETRAKIGDTSTMGEILHILDDCIDKPGINPASGGHLGYIPGGGVYPAAIGDFLAAVSNRYSGVWFANPGAVKLENMLIKWLCRLIGYPEKSLGNLTSGGSIANLIAIVTARDAMGITTDKISKSVIYITQQAHHSLVKAIRIAGLRECIVRKLAVDERFRMDTDELKNQIAQDKKDGLNPFLVISSFGTTDTGAVDPMKTIAEVCSEHELWFHIDAAYGGFFLLSELIGDKASGVEMSDSFTIDPHKGLFLPYGSGAVLIKDVDAQLKSHFYQANYMQDAMREIVEFSPADLSPELTKHFRAMRMWVPLKLFGLDPFKAALDEKILLCRYFHKKIKDAGFEVGPDPDLSVCIFRYSDIPGDTNEWNSRLIEYIHKDGRVFLSSTTIDGVFWLRMAILSFRTHKETIDLALDVVLEAQKRVSGSLGL